MELTVEQIAQLVGGTIHGDKTLVIVGVNGIAEAGQGELTFARSAQYFQPLRGSSATAALVPQEIPDAPMTVIVVTHPDVAFFQVLQHFAPAPIHPVPGIHGKACVAEDTRLGANVAVGACATIESGVVLGDNAVVFPGVYIGRDCRIGADTVLYPNVTVREACEIGARCIIHAGACIGSDGFGFAPMGGCWHKIPQTGTVRIGDDVEIGSNTAVDRATFGVTKIDSGTKIDNLVQIGHNVTIGAHCVIAGMAGIAGSAHVGNHVRIGADAGIAGHIEIADGAAIGARAGVMRSVEKNTIVSGFPAIDHNSQRRVLVAQQRTPEMLKRLARLERRIQELEESLNDETTDHK